VTSPQVAVNTQGHPTVVWPLSDLSSGQLIQSARGHD
jgi:hypothetical protein